MASRRPTAQASDWYRLFAAPQGFRQFRGARIMRSHREFHTLSTIGRLLGAMSAAAAVAASSIERALIGSTVAKSVPAQAFGNACAGAECPASRLNGQIGRNCYRW